MLSGFGRYLGGYSAVRTLNIVIRYYDMKDERDRIRRNQKAEACALLAATHAHVSTVIARIDALSDEVSERQRAAVELRAQARAETKAWFKSHAEEAEALAAFFCPDSA